MSHPISVETFAGGGGFLLGAKAAGFKCAMAVDIDPLPLNVLQTFDPEIPTVAEDIFDMQASRILKDLGIRAGDLDHFHGSWPCQEFSNLNVRARQNPSKEVGRFLYAFTDRVVQLQPKVVTGENVLGATTGFAYPLLLQAAATIRAAGYEVITFKVNCSAYGVPQRRPRMFIIAKRKDLPGELSVPPIPSVDPASLTIGSNFPGVTAALSTNYQRAVYTRSMILPTVCASPSIKFCCGGRYRRPTIRELLIAQTFPPAYAESIASAGINYETAHRLIGNAVPCLAAQHIMKHLATYLGSTEKNVKINCILE